MKSIREVQFVEEIIEGSHGFWAAGWGEYHAGNVSYLLSDSEEKQLEGYLSRTQHIKVSFDISRVEGKTFIVTRSGGSFRTILKRYNQDLGIIRFRDGGYDILWGLDGGNGRPTSELPTHILCHSARLEKNSKNKIVMHCHPTYINAMTLIHSLDENDFTRTLWSLNSECVLVFPEGLGVLPWMVCGNGPIGHETAKKMKTKRVVIWPFHGIFASAESVDDAIGLIETIEKNAQVYVLTHDKQIHSISEENIEKLARHFSINI